MRGVVFFIATVLLAPMCEASPTVVLILSLEVTPPSQTVNSSVGQMMVVTFNGDASVQKLPYEKCTVTLTVAVDVGWQSSVTPSQMVFTSSYSSQYFTATVNVPIGTPSMTGNLTVNGRAVVYGIQTITSVKALISVNGAKVLNSTASNHTVKHTTSGTGASANIGGSTIGMCLAQ